MKTQLAKAGRQWIFHGFEIFKKQPFELLFLLVLLIFIKLLFSIIPFAGQIIPIIISPLLGMAYMEATRDVDAGKKFKFDILISVFKTPYLKPLLLLGLLYAIAFLCALALSTLFDHGALWKHFLGIEALDPKKIDKAGIGSSALILMCSFFPIAIALWFAAPLVMWKEMPLSKAVFYSVFAVWRSKAAMGIYFITLIAAIFSVSILFNVIYLLVPAIAGVLQTFALIPILIAMTVILQCTFYTSYISIFGEDEKTVSLQKHEE